MLSVVSEVSSGIKLSYVLFPYLSVLVMADSVRALFNPVLLYPHTSSCMHLCESNMRGEKIDAYFLIGEKGPLNACGLVALPACIGVSWPHISFVADLVPSCVILEKK